MRDLLGKSKLNIVIMALCAIGLSLVVIFVTPSAIDKISGVNQNLSIYNETTFDFTVDSPSFAQVEEFVGNDVVNKILPCNIVKDNVDDISTLLTDKIDNYACGFFNEDRLVKGNFNANGIMADERAAEKNKLDIGSKYNIKYKGVTFEKEICAIYRNVDYPGFDNGVILLSMTPEMLELNKNASGYHILFVDVNDKAAFQNLTKGYFPYGKIDTKEKFKEFYPDDGSMTSEEYNKMIDDNYTVYYNKCIEKKYKNCIVDKDIYKANSLDTNEFILKNTNKKVLSVSICLPIVYLVCAIICLIINVNRRYNYKGELSTLNKFDFWFYLIPLLVILIVAVSVAQVWKSSVIPYENITEIANLLSLTILAGLVIIPISWIVNSKTYK